jgi:hypothetical protein
MEKERLEKLKIACTAYHQVKTAIEIVERINPEVHCHWDGCITVGEELFHEREMEKYCF